MKNENIYSQPLTLKNVLKFAIPTIIMTVFMSFYTMVDGLFVSNLIGTDALSAINLTAPVISIVTAVSTMLATGGSAVIMKKVGEKKTREANEDFTFLIIVNIIVGLMMSCFGYLIMDSLFESMEIMKKVGEKKTREANEDFTFLIIVNIIVGLMMSCFGYLIMDSLFESMDLSEKVFGYCHTYLSRYLIFTVPILLMNNFTLYMIAAGKSALSMICSVTFDEQFYTVYDCRREICSFNDLFCCRRCS